MENKSEWYRKLLRKLNNIKSGELHLNEYIDEVKAKIEAGDQALSMSGVGGELICPNCDNPYPHTRTDDTHYCEECGHDWAD